MNLEEYQQEALNHALTKLTIPEGYEGKSVRSVKQDKVDVWVFRYEKANGENNGLGGEQYSFTVTQDKYKVVGVMWMDQRFEKGQSHFRLMEKREKSWKNTSKKWSQVYFSVLKIHGFVEKILPLS
ncbi:hypothetical protein ACVBAX_21175 [Robertmurraya sp. GLU-23]